MSELSDLVGAVDRIRLRQSRAIARLIDRRGAAMRERGPDAPDEEDIGYEFTVAVLAAVLDKTPAEIEELGGSIAELAPLLTRVMRLAGFAAGEAGPAATATSSAGSGGSTPPSPPAMDMRPHRSAK